MTVFGGRRRGRWGGARENAEKINRNDISCGGSWWLFGGDEAESKGKSKILTIRLLISDEGVWVGKEERDTISMIVLMALITSSVTAQFDVVRSFSRLSLY